MKRSQSENFEIQNKHIKLDGFEETSENTSSENTNQETMSQDTQETINSTQDMSEDTQNTMDTSNEFLQQDFVPSDIEKQIICKSLAMICRSNMYDWNVTNNKEMILCELGILSNCDKFLSCNVTVNVKYNHQTTNCVIIYSLENEITQSLQLEWDEYYDIIYISKIVNQKYWLFFNAKVLQTFTTIPEDCDEDSWCYFQDARRHLNRICL